MTTEKRMIYLEDALKAVSSDYMMGSMPDHDLALLLTARRKLKALPTVDAVEVVHGRWDRHASMVRTPFALNYDCSICDEESSKTTNYCPNCVAKMDLEE